MMDSIKPWFLKISIIEMLDQIILTVRAALCAIGFSSVALAFTH